MEVKKIRKILLLTGCGIFLHSLNVAASDWYVRPRTGEYGVEDGMSYETAWDGVNSIIWGEGGVDVGDALYVCGNFYNDREANPGALISIGASGSEGKPIIIRGDYPGDPGFLVAAKRISSWTDNGDGTYQAPWSNLGPAAWEGTPGVDDRALKPVGSVDEVRSTDGSHFRKLLAISNFSDLDGGEVQVDCAENHQAITGDTLRIYGTTHYNGKYTVTVLDSDSFKITATWVSDDATGRVTDDIMWYNPLGDPQTPRTMYTNWYWAADGNGHSYITLYKLAAYGGGSDRGVIQFDRIGDPITSSYFTVDSCTVKYAATDGIRNGLPGHHYNIINNTITDFTVGIYIVSYKKSPDNVTISGNYLDHGDPGYYSYWAKWRAMSDRGAIAMQPGDDYKITDNHITRAVDYGIFFFRYSSHSMKNMHILRNRIDEVSDPFDEYYSFGIGMGGGNGPGAGDNTSGMVIAHNIVKNCKRNSYNGNYGIGLRLSTGKHTDPSDRPLIYGNVVTGCDTNYRLNSTSTPSDEHRGEYVFYNNISYFPNYAHLRIDYGISYDLDMGHNIWYPDTSADNNKFFWQTTLADNFSDFIAKAAAEGVIIGENSLIADPMFVDFNNSDFHLQSDSPAIDAGIDVGLTQDFEGNPVPQGSAPDIGVFEYMVGSDDPQPEPKPDPEPDPDPPIEPEDTLPDRTELTCYNNIFNPAKGNKVIIKAALREQAELKLTVYNSKGKKIIIIAEESKPFGFHTYTWDGKDDSGNTVGSGIYVVHMKAGEYTETKKIAVIK